LTGTDTLEAEMSTFAKRQKQIKEEAAKEAIYEAAVKVIARNRGEGLKMSEIADAVGIATGTLYNYFKNKDRLLIFVDQRLHETIDGIMSSFSDDNGPARERLAKLTEALFHFAEEHHAVFDLAKQLGIVAQIPVGEKQGRIDRTVEIIRKILDDGIRRGEFRSFDANAAARFYLAGLIGMMELQRYSGVYDFSRYCQWMLDALGDFWASPVK